MASKLVLRPSAHSYEIDQMMLAGGQKRRVERLLKEQLLRDAYLSPHKAHDMQQLINEHLQTLQQETFDKLEKEDAAYEPKSGHHGRTSHKRRLSPTQIKSHRPHSPSMNHEPIAPTRSDSPKMISRSSADIRGHGKPLSAAGSTRPNKLLSQTQQLPERPKTSTCDVGGGNTLAQSWTEGVQQGHGRLAPILQPVLPSEPFQKPIHDKDMLSKHSSSLVRTAAGVWDSLVENLYAAAEAVMYRDLVEVANMREPPASVVTIVGYLCVLLGLTPSWQVARRSLFKELIPLQKFLREVDPMSIPIRRIRKAYELKENVLCGVSEDEAAEVSASVGKLMKWICCFQKLADLMLSVEQRRRDWKESGIHHEKNNTSLNMSSVWDDESLGMQSAGAPAGEAMPSRRSSPNAKKGSPPRPPKKGKAAKSGAANRKSKSQKQTVQDNASVANSQNSVDVLSFFEDLAHDESRFELWSLSGSDVDHAEILAMQQFVHSAEEAAATGAFSRMYTRGAFAEKPGADTGREVPTNTTARTGELTVRESEMYSGTNIYGGAPTENVVMTARANSPSVALMPALTSPLHGLGDELASIKAGLSLLQDKMDIMQGTLSAADSIIEGLISEDLYCIKLATMLACQLAEVGDLGDVDDGFDRDSCNKVDDYVISPNGTARLLQLFRESVDLRLDADEEQEFRSRILSLLCTGLSSGESEIVEQMTQSEFFPHLIRCLYPDRILALRIQATMALSFASRHSDHSRKYLLGSGVLHALLKVHISAVFCST
jgi:hypothetical protein